MIYRFLSNCVNTTGSDVNLLNTMIEEAVDITRGTFLKHVHRADVRTLEAALGYETHHSKGLIMSRDWHVSYHQSKWDGKRCYYFRHSAIEYYFIEDGPGTAEVEVLDDPRRSQLLSGWRAYR